VPPALKVDTVSEPATLNLQSGEEVRREKAGRSDSTIAELNNLSEFDAITVECRQVAVTKPKREIDEIPRCKRPQRQGTADTCVGQDACSTQFFDCHGG
jgi:hypothetical protein